MQFHKFFQCGSALVFVLMILASASRAAEMTKDEVDFHKRVFVDKKTGAHIPYRLYVPTTYSRTQKYPLIFWLHGGSGRGSDNVNQLSRNDTKGTHFWISPENQQHFPAFVFVPQCPVDDNWSDPEINQPTKSLLVAIEALDAVQKEFTIDPDRIYLAGQSMGGLGVWALIQLYPERWAGALVMSAFDNFTNTDAIRQVPVWVFQGDGDRSVPVDLVRQMMKQLKKVNANFRYTEYHKVDHDVWNKAFAEPDLVPWLSAQKRGQPSPPASPGAQGQVGSSAPPANH
jgi:predicted peptidase